jgi:hypothetical protein
MNPAMLALQLAPAAIKLGQGLLNKPNKSDYENRHASEALQNMISNNQADIVNKTLLNQTTASAKSLGSRLYQQAERGIDIAGEKGLLSEGQRTGALLNAATSIQSEVGEQQQQALLANTEKTLALKDRIDQANLQLAQIKDQASASYRADKAQWGSDMTSIAADSIIKSINNASMQNALKPMFAGKDSNLANWDTSELMGLMTTMQLMGLGFDPTSLGK